MLSRNILVAAIPESDDGAVGFNCLMAELSIESGLDQWEYRDRIVEQYQKPGCVVNTPRVNQVPRSGMYDKSTTYPKYIGNSRALELYEHVYGKPGSGGLIMWGSIYVPGASLDVSIAVEDDKVVRGVIEIPMNGVELGGEGDFIEKLRNPYYYMTGETPYEVRKRKARKEFGERVGILFAACRSPDLGP